MAGAQLRREPARQEPHLDRPSGIEFAGKPRIAFALLRQLRVEPAAGRLRPVPGHQLGERLVARSS